MKLQHFSNTLISDIESRQQFKSYMDAKLCGCKPEGLWVSDENAENSWSEWCCAEAFRDTSQQICYDITLKNFNRVLFIRSIKEFLDFNKEYSINSSVFRKVIDWYRVAQHYSGIVITPYQYEMRHNSEASWYYGWDCASGCIWDATQIESFEQVTQFKQIGIDITV